MKKSLFSSPAQLCLLLSTLFAASALIFGCKPTNKSDLVGVYARNYLGVNETITINSNGTFKQNITYPDGQTWTLDDVWSQLPRGVQLERFYRTFDIEKNAIITPPDLGYAANFIKEGEKLSHSDIGLYDFVKEKK